MKQFLFCENQEGGMERGVYSEAEAVAYCVRAAQRMTRTFGEAPHEARLVAWLKVAKIGDMHEYRIGIWVRLKDA